MKRLLLSLLLCSCAVSPQRPQDPPNALVFKDEYIISAQGDWQPWAKGLRSASVYPAGVYRVYGDGTVIPDSGLSIQAKEIVLYDPAMDKCSELKSKEVSCSPNYLMKAY